MESMRRTLTFYLLEKLFQGIRKRAKRLGMTQSDYIRSVINRDLEKARRLQAMAV
jgi:hypothetical protein